ncbi:hypothetical protein GIB67_015264 [Kingdonia uniflora]|uniref:Uncharacterized protein n=1 Tax=Kingdonia uniflora TaxID=39325 RepID=A0A7J7MTC6_9MAGN|nr:hypothetical protein GIB67_015264 [Kingdonia uniflora]
MATTTTTTTTQVCFSFAAYAKNVITHLKSLKIPVTEGLTNTEFTTIETSFNFTFPPDLRSILREGLPVGPLFPNWRSSSSQQLEILINLPILGIRKEITKGNFWCESWGVEPFGSEERVTVAMQFWREAPILVPIYRNCYIASDPGRAGNPVFFISGSDLRYSGFDVAGFFQQVEFRPLQSQVKLPAWAAKSARRIKFWSNLVENGTCGERGLSRGRWREVLGDCFERLRIGGWDDEEVREMMTNTKTVDSSAFLGDKESVEWHVRVLSVMLTRAGWSADDVLDSLGCHEGSGGGADVDSFWLDFQISTT